MAAEDFFKRWSKPAKTLATDVATPSNVDMPTTETKTECGLTPLPSMGDVARLTPESDYSGFLAKGVDETVKRSALKKLFADPHFNVMDGLDIYVGDYSQPDPMPPGMLAALNHAQALLNPLQQFEQSLMIPAEPLPASDRASVAQVADAAEFPESANTSASSNQSADQQQHTIGAAEPAASDVGATSPEITKDRA
jgi:hypothetical protein